MSSRAYAPGSQPYQELVHRIEAIDRTASVHSEREPVRCSKGGFARRLTANPLLSEIYGAYSLSLDEQLRAAARLLVAPEIKILSQLYGHIDIRGNKIGYRARAANDAAPVEQELANLKMACGPKDGDFPWLLSRLTTTSFFTLALVAGFLGIVSIQTGSSLKFVPAFFAVFVFLVLAVISIAVRRNVETAWRGPLANRSR